MTRKIKRSNKDISGGSQPAKRSRQTGDRVNTRYDNMNTPAPPGDEQNSKRANRESPGDAVNNRETAKYRSNRSMDA